MANVKISGLPVETTAAGTDVLPIVKSGVTSQLALSSLLQLATGSSTVNGTGSAGQVSFWQDLDTLTGSANLFWDDGNSRLGIGTSPTAKLHIQEDVDSLLDIRIENQTPGVGAGAGFLSVSNSSTLSMRAYDDGYVNASLADSAAIIAGSTSEALILASNNIAVGGEIRFYTGVTLSESSRVMTITNSGSVGIGVTSPLAKFHLFATEGVEDELMRLENDTGTVFAVTGSSGAGVGFIMLPVTGGVPTEFHADGAMVVDNVNNFIYVRSGGAWLSSSLA